LNPGGYLMLGSSESISGFTDLFTPVDKQHRIFAKKTGVRPAIQFPPRAIRNVALPDSEGSEASPEPVSRETEIGKSADRIVLNRFAPAGVVIDSNLDIVPFRGRTGTYLESPQGAPSLNVLKMARGGLLVELRAAIQKAKKSEGHVRAEGVRMENGAAEQLVDIDVIQLNGDEQSSHLLILFSPSPRATPAAEKKAPARGPTKSDRSV